MTKPEDRKLLDELEAEELSEKELMGSPLSPAERIAAVLSEVDGVFAQYRITNWEQNWLLDNKDSKWPTFTPRMEKIMRQIEEKVFAQTGKEDEQIDELTGELSFKGKKK